MSVKYWVIVDGEGKPIENAYRQVLLYKEHMDAVEECKKVIGGSIKQTFIPRVKRRHWVEK